MKTPLEMACTWVAARANRCEDCPLEFYTCSSACERGRLAAKLAEYFTRKAEEEIR